MKRPEGFLLAALLAAVVIPGIAAEMTAAVTPVIAQELMKVRASDRIQAATWTRRPDAYTLQLVFHPLMPPMAGRNLKPVEGSRILPALATSEAQPQPTRQSEVSVWLLRADGTQLVNRIPRTTPPPESCVMRCNAIEVLYRFPIAEGSQAVAAVVRVGDNFYIDKLEPLEAVRD